VREERRLRRISNTPQVELAKSRRFLRGREAIEGNAADDTLMVDQGIVFSLTYKSNLSYTHTAKRKVLLMKN
jgi:hypothetical protein